MAMQDNEFDDIFRSKLEGFEAEPSERVWMGVDEELHPVTRKKIWLPVLRIAASVIILITAGLLFIPRHVKVDRPKNNKNGIAKVPVKQTPATGTTTEPAAKQPEIVKQPEPVRQPAQQPEVNRMAHVNTKKEKVAPVIANQPQPVEVKQTPEVVKEQDKELLAIVNTTDIKNAVVPDKSTELTIKTLPADNTPQVTKPQQAIAQAPVGKQPAKQVKRHGIHSFGDLVNLVVAKVDKRKDKAIEFSDSDDDESMITAVNIGPVKVKAEERAEK
ncbi:MAG TPA: hypothetical protein VL525_18980 [Mucilaginibacter sp.]|jgi:hypothetical protein|nr:hypothetical protein [Mucilaginibacter sp.]